MTDKEFTYYFVFRRAQFRVPIAKLIMTLSGSLVCWRMDTGNIPGNQ